MQLLDYGRSFVTFVTPGRGNNARLQIESTCRLLSADQAPRDYYFFASCKSENTFAERDLFHEDNYDFCGLFSDSEYAIYRTKAVHHDGFCESGVWRERFEDVQWTLNYTRGEVLDHAEAIVRATLDGRVLIGTVEWESEGVHCAIEFPIKTMNANDLHMIWQVDTGPVVFPTGLQQGRLGIETFSPAYVAYNSARVADFIAQGPLNVGDVAVTHYHQRISVEAQARVFALIED